MPGLPSIIDFHVHLCRSLDEEKLVFPRNGWPDEWYWGYPDAVISYMDTWNVSHLVTLNIMDTGAMTSAWLRRTPDATDADKDDWQEKMRARVRNFNDWACELHRSQHRIIPFVMGDPVLFGAGVVEEIDRCLQNGAVGVKLHPSICRHYPDDPRALPIYELCSDRGIPVLTDTGGRASPTGEFFGSPINWRPVLKQFPQMKIVLAHMCGERWDEQIALAAEFTENVFWDMSGGLVDATHPVGGHREMLLEDGARVFRKIGTDRILFGSDGPGGRHEVFDTVAQLMQLGLSDDENRHILHDNATELLGLGARV